MPTKDTATLAPFNHPMHIANTIAKRKRELWATMEAIEQSGATGKAKLKLQVQAWGIFEIAMTEIEDRIKATA